jgi:hypothetical protein
MNDEHLEQLLRKLPTPELPEVWCAEIVANALREARASTPARQAWPPLLVLLRNLFARNPFTAGALTALWLLIFFLKAGTPVDPAEKALIARFDPSQPVHLVSLQDEIQLAELLQEPPEPRPIP